MMRYHKKGRTPVQNRRFSLFVKIIIQIILLLS